MSFEGERLKALRTQNNLTQQDLASKSGIGRDQIAKIETGTRRMSATDAAFLALGLGVRADALVSRPRPTVRWRIAGEPPDSSVQTVGEWFADYVDDALYLKRRVDRYGLE